MADSSVAVTSGSGTNFDTRTEGTNSNHRPVVVLGDPATNAGVAPVDATAGLKVDLGADNDVAVTGTVDLGATDNAVLDSIQAAVETLDDVVKTEDLQHSSGDKGVMAFAVRQSGGGALANADNDYIPLTTDGDGRLWTSAEIDTALPAGTNNIGDVDIASIAAGDNNIGNVDVVTMPTVTVTATNLDVQSGGADLATTAQGAAIQTATELIDDAIFVDDADWTADTSKHALVGGVTQVATTANTDGDVTPLTTNAFRELYTAIPESDLPTAGTSHVKKYYANAGAVTDGIIWSPAAGKRWFVTDLILNVSAACTVTFEDDKAGGDEAVMKFELAANSGISHTFNTPWYSGEDAADLLITTTAGNVYVTVTGYEK